MKSQVEVQATSAEKEEVRGSKSIQQSCNQAGTGAIDLFTGDISFVHEDVNWQGTQIPMGISHIYSSKFYDKEADETYKCGVGWRLSILQTLKEDPEAESEAPDFKSYIYTDASGIKQTISTRYYKTITSDDGTREFKIYGTEKDGSNGEEISNGTYKLAVGSTQNILTDKAGNKLKFNVSDGRLVGMETVDGLKLTVTYNANSIDVTDFNNRKLTLGFSGNKLQSIMSGTSLIRSYSYQTNNSKNYLKSIENYFGESNFEYNDSGYLYKITDPSKYIVEYKIGADEDYLCTGFKIKSKAKEISYNSKVKLGVTEADTEQELENITITYNAEFSQDAIGRFAGFYFPYYMENMTMVENRLGVKEFYNFNPDGTLSFVLDGKANQAVNYMNVKTKTVDDEGIWNKTETTQISANVLYTFQCIKGGEHSRWPIEGENGERGTFDYLCGTCTDLDPGCYVFTAVVNGNIVSGARFESLSDKQAQNTSYVVLKVVRHLSENERDETFIRLEPSSKVELQERLAAIPFFVDEAVTSVDLYLEVRNCPNAITVTYWDVVAAAKGTKVVTKDNDYAETTTYNGKFCTTSKSDLSKRADKTKRTTIERKGSGILVELKTTYQSNASEKIISQDDGIYLKRSYTYDNYGNITAEDVISRWDPELKMKRKYSYLDSSSNMNRNALFTEWDENGNATKYKYKTYGFLSDVITPVDSQDIYYHYINGSDYGSGDGVLGSIYARESANVEETCNEFCYNFGYLTRLIHWGTKYDFVYDGFGRITKISVDNTDIIETIYTDNGMDIDGVSEATSKVVTSYSRNGLLVNLLCGMSKCGQAIVTPSYDENRQYNDVYVSYYNCFGELIKVRHAFGRDPRGEFNAEDDYISIQDYGDIVTYETKSARYEYRYDGITDRPLKGSEYENGRLKIQCENKEPDKFGRDSGIKITLDNGEEMEYTYAYKWAYEDSISGVTLPSAKKSTVETDELGRIKSRTLNTPSEMTNRYEYKASESYSGYTTPLVSKETFKVGDTGEEEYRYTYDANNNITSIKDKNDKLVVSYQYDGLNRLIRENIAGGDTTVYKYDKDGNIQLCKRVSFESGYGHTIEDILGNITGGEQEYKYTFVNKDLVSSYNGSELLVYDNCGQPVMWFKHGAEKSSLKYILQWSELCLMAVTDADTQKMYYYKYNDHGIRTEKVIDGIRHKYYLQGEQIIAEKIGDKYIKYYYDGTGICGFNYDGTDYYYQKNIFRDILKIYDGKGKLYGEYGYTAWGKCRIKTHVNGIGEINPFRYRGYYYDEEISLYYLNARYYDPEIGRFISADRIEYLSPESINGLNLYAYCGNNPVMNMDPSGHLIISLIVGLSVSFAISFTASTISQGIQYGWQNINWGQSVVDGLFSVASTALAATGIGAVASVMIGAAMGFGQYAIDSAFHGESLTWGGALLAIGLGAIAGRLSGAGASNGKVLADGMSGRAAAGMKAVITTVNRYGMNSAAYKNVMNLYGKAISASVQNTINKKFTASVLVIWGSTIGTPIAQYWGGRLFGLMGI